MILLSRFFNTIDNREELIDALEAARMPIFFSDEDVVCNVNKFINHQSPVLWITGMSGGGKTTLTKEMLLKQEHCSVLLLDDVTWIYNHLDKVSPTDKLLKKEYLNDIYLALKKYAAGDNVTAEGYFSTLTTEMHKIINKATNKKQLIIDGILVTELYKHDPSLFKDNHAIIIKGTSLVTSFFRRIKRDDTKISKILELIPNYGYWYNKQNEFRKHITPNTESYNESEK